MLNKETIVSIATSAGIGAIGIIRISGNISFAIANKMFIAKEKTFEDLMSHKLTYGHIVNPENSQRVDEVLLCKMMAPNTYTREDVIEIHCHGAPLILDKIIQIACSLGARIADPGEFTKRAFLNGRIDLSQAEAVMDIIYTKAEEGLKASLDQLDGKLSRRITKIRSKLIEMLSHVEALVDYPEYDIPEISKKEILEGCIFVSEKLVEILSTYDKGRIIREGLQVVIVGVPNVGKSSLLNSLSGKDRAIITDIPGTTRDVLEEYITLGGIQVKLLDTAGIRGTEDVVESIGVKRSYEHIKKADLVFFMVDGSKKLSDDDKKIYEEINNQKTLLIINKIDKANQEIVNEIEASFKDLHIVKASVLEDTGLNALEEYIREHFLHGNISINQELILTNVRHKALLDQGLKSIQEAISSLNFGMPLDLITIDIMNAAQDLGSITGESVKEDIVHEIFSRFCIGK
jgi:tRNA modification GTPase